jgi:hypothetical protein
LLPIQGRKAQSLEPTQEDGRRSAHPGLLGMRESVTSAYGLRSSKRKAHKLSGASAAAAARPFRKAADAVKPVHGMLTRRAKLGSEAIVKLRVVRPRVSEENPYKRVLADVPPRRIRTDGLFMETEAVKTRSRAAAALELPTAERLLIRLPRTIAMAAIASGRVDAATAPATSWGQAQEEAAAFNVRGPAAGPEPNAGQSDAAAACPPCVLPDEECLEPRVSLAYCHTETVLDHEIQLPPLMLRCTKPELLALQALADAPTQQAASQTYAAIMQGPLIVSELGPLEDESQIKEYLEQCAKGCRSGETALREEGLADVVRDLAKASARDSFVAVHLALVAEGALWRVENRLAQGPEEIALQLGVHVKRGLSGERASQVLRGGVPPPVGAASEELAGGEPQEALFGDLSEPVLVPLAVGLVVEETSVVATPMAAAAAAAASPSPAAAATAPTVQGQEKDEARRAPHVLDSGACPPAIAAIAAPSSPPHSFTLPAISDSFDGLAPPVCALEPLPPMPPSAPVADLPPSAPVADLPPSAPAADLPPPPSTPARPRARRRPLPPAHDPRALVLGAQRLKKLKLKDVAEQAGVPDVRALRSWMRGEQGPGSGALELACASWAKSVADSSPRLQRLVGLYELRRAGGGVVDGADGGLALAAGGLEPPPATPSGPAAAVSRAAVSTISPASAKQLLSGERADAKPVRRRGPRTVGCGTCAACLRAEACGDCNACRARALLVEAGRARGPRCLLRRCTGVRRLLAFGAPGEGALRRDGALPKPIRAKRPPRPKRPPKPKRPARPKRVPKPAGAVKLVTSNFRVDLFMPRQVALHGPPEALACLASLITLVEDGLVRVAKDINARVRARGRSAGLMSRRGCRQNPKHPARIVGTRSSFDFEPVALELDDSRVDWWVRRPPCAPRRFLTRPRRAGGNAELTRCRCIPACSPRAPQAASLQPHPQDAALLWLGVSTHLQVLPAEAQARVEEQVLALHRESLQGRGDALRRPETFHHTRRRGSEAKVGGLSGCS